MKRRSVLGALVGLVMAPFAVKAKTKDDFVIDWIDVSNFQPPVTDSTDVVDVDWYRVWESKRGLTDDGGFINPHCEIRYRVNGGEWQQHRGRFPVKLSDNANFVVYRGMPTISIGPLREIRFI